jgi:hypothetical protein
MFRLVNVQYAACLHYILLVDLPLQIGPQKYTEKSKLEPPTVRWGQDVDRFLKLGNFASTLDKLDRPIK